MTSAMSAFATKRTSELCPRRGNFPFSRSGGDGFDDADGRFGRHNSL
jgi:hypothetical protein